jgi:hypothetical protein
MKNHSFIAAVAATLSTACGPIPVERECYDPGTVTFYWSFTTAEGQVLSCQEAGIDTIRIEIDGQTIFSPCVLAGTEGVRLNDFYQGVYPYTLYALRGGEEGGYLYMDQGAVETGTCQNPAVNSAMAATQADLGLAYFFDGRDTCVANGEEPVDYVRYAISDIDGNMVAYGDLVCDDAHAFAIPELPFGAYTLRWLQGLQFDPGSAQNVAVYQKCDVPIQHWSAGAIVVNMPVIPEGAPACQ